jgi:hypothetical protein
VPEWASFFDSPKYAAFVDAVSRELERRSDIVQIEDGVAHVRATERGEAHAFGLQNLAQICNQVDEADWPDIIRQHFDGVVRSTTGGDLEDLSDDFERASEVLKVRLYPAEAVEDSLDGLQHRVVGEGIVAVLAYDLPDAVATVPRADVARWPVDVDEAFRIGLRNVLAETGIEHERIALESGAVFSAMVGDSFFVTSRLLALDKFISPTSRHGALVAVPNRHTLLWAPIVDLGVLEVLNALLVIARRRHEEGPGSLSPNLYWWRTDGSLVTLPAEIEGDALQFSPPVEFLEECLNQLEAPGDPGFGPN